MLIDFTIENFRSIKSPQTLSLLATSTKEHPENSFSLSREKKIRLLKSAVIYGANASGKSNVLKALGTMLTFIKDSTDVKAGHDIPYYQPFKLDKECLAKPTRFEMEFVCDEIRYRYFVAYTATFIEEEGLYFYPNKIETKLFLRKQGNPIEFGNALKGARRGIEEQLLENVLFLSKAANSNNKALRNIYTSIHNGILIHTYSSFFSSPTNYMLGTKKLPPSLISQFISTIDTGITEIVSTKTEFHKSSMPNLENYSEDEKTILLESLSFSAKSAHRATGFHEEHIHFNIDEESDGTVKSYALAGFIFTVILRGGTLVIDELNNSLHPIIVRFIIQLFNNEKSNPRNAQLIFSTHDTTLLDPSLFRRDQIWFTEKNDTGETKLFSMSEFDYKEIRKDTPFSKWYLSGKFGAIPIVNDFSILVDEIANAQAKKAERAQDQSKNPHPL